MAPHSREQHRAQAIGIVNLQPYMTSDPFGQLTTARPASTPPSPTFGSGEMTRSVSRNQPHLSNPANGTLLCRTPVEVEKELVDLSCRRV